MSNNFKTEDPPPPPVDPNLEQAQADAKDFKTRTLQDQLRGDSASIMARYGTTLALAGSLPSVTPAPAAVPQPTGVNPLSPPKMTGDFGAFTPFVAGFAMQNKGMFGG